MNDVIAAGRYTRALFELAKKENRLPEMDTALHALARILDTEPKVLSLIANPTLTTDQKYALASKAISEGPNSLLERFLKVLIDTKRFALLPEIQKIFHDTFEKEQGIQEVQMVSAASLSSAFLEKLKTILTKKLRTEIRLIPKTDRALLGGFVLRFSGKEIDCSFKNRLYEIQQQLFANEALGEQSL